MYFCAVIVHVSKPKHSSVSINRGQQNTSDSLHSWSLHMSLLTLLFECVVLCILRCYQPVTLKTSLQSKNK